MSEERFEKSFERLAREQKERKLLVILARGPELDVPFEHVQAEAQSIVLGVYYQGLRDHATISAYIYNFHSVQDFKAPIDGSPSMFGIIGWLQGRQVRGGIVRIDTFQEGLRELIQDFQAVNPAVQVVDYDDGARQSYEAWKRVREIRGTLPDQLIPQGSPTLLDLERRWDFRQIDPRVLEETQLPFALEEKLMMLELGMHYQRILRDIAQVNTPQDIAKAITQGIKDARTVFHSQVESGVE